VLHFSVGCSCGLGLQNSRRV